MSARSSGSRESSEGLGLFLQRDSFDEVLRFCAIEVSRCDSGAGDALEVTFVFSFCDDCEFKSQLRLERVAADVSPTLYRALFNVGMIVIAQTVAAQVQLDQEMMEYWSVMFDNVLAEYIYVNKLSFHHIDLSFTPYETAHVEWDGGRCGSVCPIKKTYSDIVPLGGGKDSLVVWHLVSEAQPLMVYVADGFQEFDLNYRLAAIVEEAKADKLVVQHDFHYQDIGAAARSYRTPCGHPWAALVLFDCVLVAHCLAPAADHCTSIHLGHEKSADEGNNLYLPSGIEVNHQYDKSSAFVALTAQYLARTARPTDAAVVVCTPLAKMYELEIVREFCSAPRLRPFHQLFLSCNEPVCGSGWCLKCDKCAFIYLLLAAFLPPASMAAIFRDDMFAREALRPTFLRLLGSEGTKPFDCVGTVEEARSALLLACHQHALLGRAQFPVVLRHMCAFCDLPAACDAEYWRDMSTDGVVSLLYE